MKKILSLLLVITVILPIFTSFVGAADEGTIAPTAAEERTEPISNPEDSEIPDTEEATGTLPPVNPPPAEEITQPPTEIPPVVDPTTPPQNIPTPEIPTQIVEIDENAFGIYYDEYSIDDIIIPGKIDGVESNEFYINLTRETITFPQGYTVAAYSINGGTSWTAASSRSTFNSAEFVKLLTKDLTLAITDKIEGSGNKRKPSANATVIEFPKINQRPKVTDLVINYAIGSDPTGQTTGTWLLSKKNSSDSVKDGIDIALADSAGKNPNKDGYGRFYGENGSTNGIPIVELPSDNREVKTSYFYRNSAKANDNGTYTAASLNKKITAEGQSKPSNYSVNKRNKTISYNANTYVFTYNHTEPELKKSKGTLSVSDYDGDVYLWSAASATSPASAMQKTSVTPGAKDISNVNTTVRSVPAVINAPAAPETAPVPVPTTQAPTAAPTTPAPTQPATQPPTQPPTQAPTAAPTVQPATQAPATAAPTTAAPATQAPVTAAPTTENVQKEIDSLFEPTTKAPTTQAPTTAAPTTQAPTTTAPAAQTPRTSTPAAQPQKTADQNTQSIAQSSQGITPAALGLQTPVELIKDQTGYPLTAPDELQSLVAVPTIPQRVITWISSNISIVTVNPSSGTSTTMTAVAIGTTTITATVYDSDGATNLGTATWTVTVIDAPAPENKTMYVGQTANLTVNGRTGTIDWTSSNNSIVSVSPATGASTTIRAVAVGNAIITATNYGADVATYNIDVKKNSDTSTIASSMVSDTRVLTLASPNNFTGNITWTTSDDTYVGLVTSTGISNTTSGTTATIKFLRPHNTAPITITASDIHGNQETWTISASSIAPYNKKITINLNVAEVTALDLNDYFIPIRDITWGTITSVPSGVISSNPLIPSNTDNSITITPLSSGSAAFTVNDDGGNTIEFTINVISVNEFTVVINAIGPAGHQGGAFGSVKVTGQGLPAGSTGGTVAPNTVVVFEVAPAEGFYVEKWEAQVFNRQTGKWENYALDPNLGTQYSYIVDASIQIWVTFAKYRIARFSVYGGIGGTISATSTVETKPATTTGDFIYIKNNGDVTFTIAELPGYSLKEWRYSPTPRTITLDGMDTVLSDQKTKFEHTLDNTPYPVPENKYLLHSYSRIVIQEEIVVEAEFEAALGISTSPAPPDGTATVKYGDNGAGYTFTAIHGAAPITDNNKIFKWYIVDKDTLTNVPPSNSDSNILPKGLVFDETYGKITGIPEKGQGGEYTFDVIVVLNDNVDPAKRTFARQRFTIYIYDLYDVDYRIDDTNSQGKLYITVGNEAEKAYDGKPGTADTIRSRTNILENTTVSFRAVPNDPSLYMVVWKVIDKDETDVNGDYIVLVNTTVKPDGTVNNIIGYGQFNDDRTVYTIPQLNKNLEVIVEFVPIPNYRVEFGVFDIVNDKPEGGSVTATASDRTPPRQLYSMGAEINNVRGGSEIVLTATPEPGWSVYEWRVYTLDANGDPIPSNTYQVAGYNPTCTIRLTGHIRIIVVFKPDATIPVTGVTVTPSPTTIGERGNQTLTAAVSPASADQRVTWDIDISNNNAYPPANDTALPTSLDERQYRKNTSSQTGLVSIEIRMPYQSGTKPNPNYVDAVSTPNEPPTLPVYSWGPWQEIIRVDRDGKVTVGRPQAPYADGDFVDEKFNVVATTVGKDASGKTKNSSPCVVTISAYVPVVGIDIDIDAIPKAITMLRGNTKTLTATVQVEFDPPVGASNKDVTWTSSNPSVARVDRITGEVTAVSPGVAIITATTVGVNSSNVQLTDTCTVTVVEALIRLDPDYDMIFERVEVPPDYTPQSHTVRVYNDSDSPTGPITITLTGPDADKFEISPASFSNIAISAYGTFTVKPKANLPNGTYTATVTVSGEQVGSRWFDVSFTVGPQPPTPPTPPKPTLTLNPTSRSIVVGDYFNITGTVQNLPSGVTVKATSWSWSVSPSGVVTLSGGSGDTVTVTGTATGSATVTATVQLSNGQTITATTGCRVVVTLRPTIIRPQELTDGPFPSKETGGSYSQLYLPNAAMSKQYNETLLTKGFETNDVIPPIYWRIIGGTLPPGLKLTQWVDQPNIGAGAEDTGSSRAGCVIEGQPTELGVGNSYTFIAEASEILYHRIGTNVVWNAPGYIYDAADWDKPNTPYSRITWANGANVVVLSAKKATRTINIFVEPTIYIPVTGVVIYSSTEAPSTADTAPAQPNAVVTVPLNGAVQLNANIFPPRATNKNMTWTTSNPTVATVDQLGNVYGHSEGTAIIEVVTADGAQRTRRTVKVQRIATTSVTLNKTAINLPVGGTDTLTATVNPDTASNKTVTYNSNDINTVTVDENGVIRAIAAGRAIITVTSGGQNANCTVTVQAKPPVPATAISLNKTVTTLKIGESEILSATVLPANTTDKSVTWSSNRPDIVSVDPVTGVITARTIPNINETIRNPKYNNLQNIPNPNYDDRNEIPNPMYDPNKTKPDTNTPNENYDPRATILNPNYDPRPTIPNPNYDPRDTIPKTNPNYDPRPTIVVNNTNYDPNEYISNPKYNLNYDKPATYDDREYLINPKYDDRETITITNPKYDPRFYLDTIVVVVTATVTGTTIKADCTVDVEPDVPANRITLNKDVTTVPIDKTEMLAATVYPINATAQTLTWRSQDPNIATVDSKGNVTGKSIGVTVIEVGTASGFSATCTISVILIESDFTTSIGVSRFVDVNPNEWYASYIEQAAEYGLIQGKPENRFDPETSVTRAEFVTMIVRALDLTVTQGTSRYGDVAGDWYTDAITTADKRGLLAKFTDVNFYPNRIITREEMAVILAAAARHVGIGYIPTFNKPLSEIFDDYLLITQGQQAYNEDVKLIYDLEIMNGKPGSGVLGLNFEPQGRATRAEAATVMVRLYHTLLRGSTPG